MDTKKLNNTDNTQPIKINFYLPVNETVLNLYISSAVTPVTHTTIHL